MTAAALSRAHRGGWFAAAAMALALLLGGGGSPAPLPEIALQSAIGFLAALWWWSLDRPLARAVPRQAMIIGGLAVALPLVQLLPLPPALWQALPGRELARDALALIGQEGQWHPWSLAPDRTLASLLAILPAIAVLLMTAEANRDGRVRILLAVTAVTLATLLVGAAQITAGPDSALRFYGGSADYLDGFQANHNSTADVLLIGMVAAVAAIRELALTGRLPNRRGPVLTLTGAAAVVCATGVVLTSSRAGILLLPLALLASLALLRPWLGLTGRRLAGGAAVIGALALGAALLIANNAALARVFARFSLTTELRPELWRDSLYAAQQYLPVGAGMGNFVPAMVAHERLEVLRETMPNRAHNELLELAVETGVFGLAALAVISALLVTALLRARRAPPAGSSGLAIFAGTALAMLALHSLVDYPFRSMSLAILAAACAGMLLPRRVDTVPGDQSDRLKETL